jgi:hypothetical protein
MAGRAEAEAAHRWARYAEDFEPDEDEMPDVGGDGGHQDSDPEEEEEDPQARSWQLGLGVNAACQVLTGFSSKPCSLLIRCQEQ